MKHPNEWHDDVDESPHEENEYHYHYADELGIECVDELLDEIEDELGIECVDELLDEIEAERA